MKRPFPVGIPVRGDDLVGREREVTQIMDLVRDGGSVVLISPRRYGKTSVLLEVLRRLQAEDFYTGEVDLFRILSKRELAQAITERVVENRRIRSLVHTLRKGGSAALKHLEIKGVVDEYEFVLDFVNPNADEERLLDTALDFPEVFCRKSGRRMVFGYDEFGDLIKLDGEPLTKKMRAIFQRHEHVAYIFTGSQESLMEKLFASRKQAFFRFGRILRLSFVPLEDFRRYIGGTFTSLGLRISEEAVESILRKTKGHPYYTQLVCQKLYYSVKGEGGEVVKEEVEEIFRDAVIAEQPYFEELWGSLMERRFHLPVLRSIALGDASPYQVFRNRRQDIYYVLASLEQKGYIRRVRKGEYELTDPLFEAYIRMRNGEVE